ncbi:hypothetical protein QBC37DRAFT_371208 [Rhypophila decipiens]|uniref:Uncharacterized protein n=1 Tax=Rhypophila decipiens TaxID=261697 RepID=A0AAN7BA08_9PEZI|nr:hypothetical protein QBC37DRAFT_371208 [Rhypophila decipiens]
MKPLFHYVRVALLLIGALLLFGHAFSSYSHRDSAPLSRRSFPSQPHNSTLLTQRDTPWGPPRREGDKYLCAMLKSSPPPRRNNEPVPTDYRSIDIQYNRVEHHPFDMTFLLNPISSDLEALSPGLGFADGGWRGVTYDTHVEEDQDLDNDNFQAWFNIMYNVQKGAIMAININNKYFKNNDIPRTKYEIQELSDMMFLTWSKYVDQAGADRKNINHIIHHQVHNADTMSFLAEALGVSGPQDPGALQGMTFFPHQDEYKVLLASPNGSAVAYFLFDHKGQLGHKTVSQVTVFSRDNLSEVSPGKEWFIVWHVKDVTLPFPGRAKL